LTDIRSDVLTLLMTPAGQPPRALRQHFLPYSDKWCCLADKRIPIASFLNREIEQLHIEGVLSCTTDAQGPLAILINPKGRQAGPGSAVQSQVGPTFHQLVADGTLGGGRPYLFDDLLNIDSVAPAPPLVFIHVPRTAGTTFNNLLMKNYKFRADSYGSSFFPPYLPTTFASLTCAPRSVDDRERPAFFTGHIDVRNDIFRYMPARYVVVTILRDPVDRIVSHYRFNSTQQSIFQDAIRDEGLDVLGYFERLGPAIPQQYEIFAPAKIGSESERVATALHNLEQFVTFFGLQERYEEFVSSAAALIGLPNLSQKPLNRLPAGAAVVTRKQEQALREALKHDVIFYERAVAMYSKRTDLLASHKFSAEHPWARFYS
jgi:Sulfotransferase family